MSLKRKATDLAADEARKPKANGNIAAFFSAAAAPKPAATASSAATDGSASKGTGAAAVSNGTTPVTSGAAAAAPAAVFTAQSKFDKEAWVAKLTDEQKELLQLEIDTLHESWLGPLRDELTSKSFLDLKRFIKKEKESGKTIFPPLPDVYSWYVSQP